MAEAETEEEAMAAEEGGEGGEVDLVEAETEEEAMVAETEEEETEAGLVEAEPEEAAMAAEAEEEETEVGLVEAETGEAAMAVETEEEATAAEKGAKEAATVVGCRASTTSRQGWLDPILTSAGEAHDRPWRWRRRRGRRRREWRWRGRGRREEQGLSDDKQSSRQTKPVELKVNSHIEPGFA